MAELLGFEPFSGMTQSGTAKQPGVRARFGGFGTSGIRD